MQKKSVAMFLRRHKKVCLAIGDGANDTNMIAVGFSLI